MKTNLPQINELDNLENVEEMVLKMRTTIKNKIDQIDADIGKNNKKASAMIRVSHEEAATFIKDHLKKSADISRKKIYRDFETACYLTQYHDVPHLSYFGIGAQSSFRIDTRKKAIGFSPMLHSNPVDLIFAFMMNDEAIEKFATDCATYFECKKGDLESGELLANTEALLNDMFDLETQKKVLQTRFESLMAIPTSPKAPDTPQVINGFLVLPRKPGQPNATITGE